MVPQILPYPKRDMYLRIKFENIIKKIVRTVTYISPWFIIVGFKA